MSWNYRVLAEETNTGETAYRIAEVYYDDAGKPDAWTLPDYNPTAEWDDVGDLKGTVELILGAFDKPVLFVADGNKLKEA